MTIDESAHAEQPIDLHALIMRTALYLALVLFLVILALYAYSAWLDVRPGNPYVWRDKGRGNTCYIHGDSMVCLGG